MALFLEKNVLLRDFTTLKLGGNSLYFSRLQNTQDLPELKEKLKELNVPLFILGGGSNVVVKDVLPEICTLKIENKGIHIIEENEDFAIIEVASGEVWDDFVEYAVIHNLSGVEALSAIPGTVGASPIQNIGAYGKEVSEVIHEVEIFDMVTGKVIMMTNEECQFSYRDSVFKRFEKGRVLITSVRYKLTKRQPIMPTYTGVQEAIQKFELSLIEQERSGNLSAMSLQQKIRNVITDIRWSKLPKPQVIPNVGSFFKNCLVEINVAEVLKNAYPNIPLFYIDEKTVKIPTGWLIEQVGLKGYQRGNVGVYEKNALVLTSNGNAQTDELFTLSDYIKDRVKKEFGLDLEIEPEIFYL